MTQDRRSFIAQPTWVAGRLSVVPPPIVTVDGSGQLTLDDIQRAYEAALDGDRCPECRAAPDDEHEEDCPCR